jgi:BclB C-terminal domain-containing protein
LASTVGLVGFGNSAPTILIAGNSIDLTGGAGTLLNFAFSVPRDGIITSIAAFFSTTSALSLLDSTVTVSAQLFGTPVPSNTLTAIPGTEVALSPPLTGSLAIGQPLDGLLTDLAVPVTAGTRLLLGFTITTTGLTLVNTVAGYGSAGITIE